MLPSYRTPGEEPGALLIKTRMGPHPPRQNRITAYGKFKLY
jgi:hypothetical protein